MKNGTVVWIGIIMFLWGMWAGLSLPDFRTDEARIHAMTFTELQGEIHDFRSCMERAGANGCRMSVPDFARYRLLKSELRSRQVEWR